MTTIAGLCNQALVLDHGNVVYPLGDAKAAVDYYHSSLNITHEGFVFRESELKINQPIRITGLHFIDEHHFPAESLTHRLRLIL